MKKYNNPCFVSEYGYVIYKAEKYFKKHLNIRDFMIQVPFFKSTNGRLCYRELNSMVITIDGKSLTGVFRGNKAFKRFYRHHPDMDVRFLNISERQSLMGKLNMYVEGVIPETDFCDNSSDVFLVKADSRLLTNCLRYRALNHMLDFVSNIRHALWVVKVKMIIFLATLLIIVRQ